MSRPQAHPQLHIPGPASVPTDVGTGLSMALARSVADVVEAWQLVYIAYRRAGLIAPNHQKLYTLPQALNPRTLIVHARLEAQVVSTLTAVPDGSAGLPLDAQYGPLLAGLRSQGQPLMEICLVGDRRDRLSRTLQVKRALMRLVLSYARLTGRGGVVTLAAAEEADLYRSEYGFEPIPGHREPATCLGRGRAPLHLDLRAAAQRPASPPGLAWCRQHPVPPEVFAQRFNFDPGTVERSLLGTFLAGHAHALHAPDAPPYGTPPTAA